MRDAFDAIGEPPKSAAAASSSANGSLAPPAAPHANNTTATSSAEPLPVHRVDTMELLLDPIPPAAKEEAGEGTRPAKRSRSGLV